MLFLAVFCGFLAENQREHFIEHKRERQFIASMTDDIRLDTSSLGAILHRRLRRKEMFDSLTVLLNSNQKENLTVRMYFFARHIQRLSPVSFTYNDRTIQQLKNGGNMRLIRNKTAAEAIVLYDAAVRDLDETEERENTYMVQILPVVYKIFDGRVMDLMVDSLSSIHPPPSIVYLLPGALQHLPDFNGAFHSLKSSNLVLISKAKAMMEKGGELLRILKKEYQVD
jgi:hypothetical protein